MVNENEYKIKLIRITNIFNLSKYQLSRMNPRAGTVL